MISDWLLGDGRKAIKIMGWPEWGTGDCFRQMNRTLGLTAYQLFHCADGTGPWLRERGIDNHEALCLLRDWAREWLDAREIEIHGVGDGHYMAWHRGEHRYLTHMGKFEAREMRDDTMFWGYDAALIAPALAVEEKK